MPLEVYAGEHTQLRRAGSDRLVGLCPLHQEKSPSFSIKISDQRYRCFGCQAHGDVIDLCMALENHTEIHTAMLSLSMRYGVEIYEKPDRWRRHQEEKVRLLDSLCKELTERRVRRYYKVFAPRLLSAAIDGEMERQLSEDLWNGLWKMIYVSTKRRLEDGHGK